MTLPLLADPPAGTPRRRRSNWRHWLGPSAIVLVLAAGGFWYWGPIGLGNGPLSVTVRGAEGTADPSQGPVGTVVPISNAGQAPAVIDGIDMVGGTRYPSPRVLASAMLTTSSDCGVAVVPAKPAATAGVFTLGGCGRYRGPLVGHVFRPVRGSSGMIAAVPLSAPQRGDCWAVTKVVVHYHVGGKHFSGIYQFQLVACLGVDSAGVEAALNTVGARRQPARALMDV